MSRRSRRASPPGAPSSPRPSTRSLAPGWPRTRTTARRRLARWSRTCCARWAGPCRRAWSRPDRRARRVSDADTGTAAPGTVFSGRYEITGPISSGAMGAVYRAIDRHTGGEVAVKRLLDVRQSARFEIEARLLASLSHPRVVKVLDHSQDEKGLYIVMELVRGTDLGAQLKERGSPGLPFGEAIDYARHACEALQYVHDQ